MIDEVYEAALICRHFEGYEPVPYQDPVGVWTVGYGSTLDWSTGDQNPMAVTEHTLPITEAEAWRWMIKHLSRKRRVLKKMENSEGLDEWSKVAMLSLLYNTGAAATKGASIKEALETLTINAGHAGFDSALYRIAKMELGEAMLRYRKGGGKTLTGLWRRRVLEVATMMEQRRLVPSREVEA